MLRREILTLIPVSSLTGDTWRPEVLSAHQDRTVVLLSERILPRTDTPGASDALVNRYIDYMLKAGLPAAERDEFLAGLQWLDNYCRLRHDRLFAELSEPDQIAVLTTINEGGAGAEGHKFFSQAKDLTLRGYYTSRPGLMQELEYRGNGVYTSYPGCTHIEHQKTAERKK
jgi:hypothetical protein